MPTDAKPLFRPEAVRPKVRAFELPARADRAKIAKWAKMFAGSAKPKWKETEVRDEFLYDIFRDALGYVTVSENPADYSFKKEQFVQVDGTYADAGFGRFGSATETPLIVLEGKGPSDPLDRPYAGRKRSAFEQALLYAYNLRIDWYVVTNLKETRLYCKQADQFTFERFETHRLAADEGEWKRFVYLLGADRVLAPAGNHLTPLLAESAKIGRELTNEFYREYRKLREMTFQALRTHNPERAPAALLTATQKVLDRVLFIAFCEDRGLLPQDSIARAYKHADPYNPRPVWQNFVGLFKAVDQGSKDLNIWQYNGGLYAKDDFLDTLLVPDDICDRFKQLAEYHYGNAADGVGKLIDVEILGHVFEQSISDLEELHRAVAGGAVAVESGEPSKRKKEGAFYTPAFVTRYILAETLGAVIRDRFTQYRERLTASMAKSAKLFLDPTDLTPAAKPGAARTALVKFWQGWLLELETIRVVDPACGSGAFLIEAFDQMFAEYEKAEATLTALGAPSALFETRKTILTNNIFGMDLNSEAVEIARLSSWIKTAEVGKVLTTLDANVVRGNSVVGDPSPLEFWKATFPAAFAAGGFDVVIGNPPYVRQEWIKADKPYLEKHYKAYDGVADLYVYFYELGLNILKPGGRLGYISSGSLFRAAYAKPLRKLLVNDAKLIAVIDMADTQVFEDAKDVYPAIIIASNDKPDTADTIQALRCRRSDTISDLSHLFQERAITVARSQLAESGWQLESDQLAILRRKLTEGHVTVGEYTKGRILRGLISGLTEAFVVTTAVRNQLVSDGRSGAILKPFVGGQHLARWHAEDSGNWLIMIPSGRTAEACESSDPAVARKWLKETYPAVEAHLSQHEAAAIRRTDQGQFWWELRACDYYDAFEKPKIIYPDIAKFPRFILDRKGVYANNTTYFIPGDDVWLVAVLNSDVSWFNLSGISIPFGERAGEFRYRLMTQYIEKLPVPKPTDAQRVQAESLVAKLTELTAARADGVQAVLDWLRAEFGVAKATNKLAGLAELSAHDFLAEVRKIRGRSATLSVADVKRLNEAYAAAVLPLHANAREADHLERRASDLVNAAYGLTPDDVALLWATAPPRMPFTCDTNDTNPVKDARNA
jgi:hypothetical protein